MSIGTTGIPEIDALIARGIRYGQTRRVEILLGAMMIAVGISLVLGGPNIRLDAFRLVFTFIGQERAGWFALLIGSMRLWFIYLNGRQHMPAWRILGCFIGFLFWGGWFFALAAIAPPIVPLCPISLVMLVGEVWAGITATKDAYASDSLWLRNDPPKVLTAWRRSAQNGGPA